MVFLLIAQQKEQEPHVSGLEAACSSGLQGPLAAVVPLWGPNRTAFLWPKQTEAVLQVIHFLVK